MTTPAAQSFASLVAATCLLFVLWHAWHYDRFQCLVYSKQDWFRATMCHILLISMAFFMMWGWMSVYVAYDEYYVYLQYHTFVAPWQLWSGRNQTLGKVALYMLCLGWAFLQSVHLEEFLYWGYLIRSISTPGGPKTSWLKSMYFRSWVLGSASGLALLLGAVQIETTNLDMMKAYLFIVGSSISVLLAFASIVLCIVFPRFMDSTRRQGATFEVLERLHFFKEMNTYRTSFRLQYSIGFLILAADALTTTKKVNSSPFWADFLFLVAIFGIFASTCLSVIILLPRNMTQESLPAQDEKFHPLVEFHPYPQPSRAGYDGSDSQKHFFELGDRLNIGRDALGNLSQALGVPAYELSMTTGRNAGQFSRPRSPVEQAIQNPHGMTPPTNVDAPFATTADTSRRARYSEFTGLPAVVQKFKSPFDVGEAKNPGPPKILVTSHTVVEE